MCTHTHAHVSAKHFHKQTHASQAQAHARAHAPAQAHAYARTQAHAQVHAQAQARAHARTYTTTHANIYYALIIHASRSHIFILRVKYSIFTNNETKQINIKKKVTKSTRKNDFDDIFLFT